jgi:uncharacterized protein YicC (UPF0701 family)
MGRKQYKPLAMDLARKARDDHEATVGSVLRFEHCMHGFRERGRNPGAEIRVRLREDAVARTLQTQIKGLDEAIRRNGSAATELGQEIEAFLRTMRAQTADIARRGVEAARERQSRAEAAARPDFSPSPY